MRISLKIITLVWVLPWVLAAGESSSLLYALPQVELGKWWKNSEIVKELALSDKQVNQLEDSFLNHRPGLVPLIIELGQHDEQLQMLMKAESLDDKAIMEQAELVASARARLEKENASLMLSIRKVLTGQQWKRLGEIRDLRNTSSALIMSMGSAATSSMVVSTPSGEKIYSMEDGIKPPQVLYRPMPSYTQAAREAKAEGIMLLKVIIRKDGNVDNIEVVRGIGYGLDESAIRTIEKEWRFSPGTLNGEPVDVQANIEVSFRIF